MNPDLVDEAAGMLALARTTGQRLKALPENCRPRSIEDAYAIQDAVALHLKERIGGWKVGAISPQHPSTVAPIFLSTIVPSPSTFSSQKLRLFGIEAELVFRLERDFPARNTPYDRDEVLAASVLYPAVEILELRFEDILAIDRLSAVADNITNGYLVYGAPVDDWRKLELTRPVVKVTANEKLFLLGIGNNGGDPGRLLMELVNHVSSRRGGISAGTMVTTGTCTGIAFSQSGTRIVAEFRKLGRVEVAFS